MPMTMTDIYTNIGNRFLDFFYNLYAIVRIIVIALNSFLFRLRVGRRATLSILYKQIYFTGVEAVPIISWIALMIGIIIVTQAISILPMMGGEGFIGKVLVWTVVRELGPLFAAIIVIARSGTAIAAELGSMKVHDEIKALEIMGINIGQYVVMPRVIGTAVAIFVLTFYFEMVAILGGYILAGFGKRIAFGIYMASIFNASGIVDVIASTLKSVVFGLIIGAVCCYHGLRVGKSITQIPQETTKAVIRSLFLIFIVDGIITAILFA